MGMASTLILTANPGSASRKYALYDGNRERAQLHFEWLQGKIICTLYTGEEHHTIHTDIGDLQSATALIDSLLREHKVLREHEKIERIGLRIVAPSSYFLEDRLVDDELVSTLLALEPRAPLHIKATLDELKALRKEFGKIPVAGISDSAFHITKPDYAWNYGISLEVADHFEIKRFGYHGLSVASVVRQLKEVEKVAARIIVCHLGSGASVTALKHGKSVDNSMGYSPLEGIIMSTRSGSIDPTAVRTLKEVCYFDDDAVEDYLNNHSGLLGLGGSSDIRELLRRESDGDHRAHLALSTYVYSVQKAIGQMTAAMGGVDALIFTGTVGERSAVIRERVVANLDYLDFTLDNHENEACVEAASPTVISKLAHSRPILVAPAQEAAEIVRHTKKLT